MSEDQQHTYHAPNGVTVQARKITHNTYGDVAEWFGLETWGAGVLVQTDWGQDHAGINDWVVRSGTKWRILTDREFVRVYRPGPA